MSSVRTDAEYGIIIPSKMYVGFQKRGEYDTTTKITTPILLGFATPIVGKKSEDERRQLTVDRWAQYKTNDESEENKKLAPITIDNVFKEGFQIVDTFKRGGYFGAARNVWRVKTPEGYELEIDSGNLALIMNYCVLENGLIKDECIWGRKGAANYLLPKGSKMVEISLNRPDNAGKSVALKDVLPGSKVRLADGTNAIYYGKYFFVTSNKNPRDNIIQEYNPGNNRYLAHKKEVIPENQFYVRDRHVYRHLNDKEESVQYSAVSTIKIGEIISAPTKDESTKIYKDTFEYILDQCLYHSNNNVGIMEQSYSSYGSAPVIHIFEKKKDADAFVKQPFSTLCLIIPKKYTKVNYSNRLDIYNKSVIKSNASFMDAAMFDLFVKDTNVVMDFNLLNGSFNKHICLKHNLTNNMFYQYINVNSVYYRTNAIKTPPPGILNIRQCLSHDITIVPMLDYTNAEMGIVLNPVTYNGNICGHEYYKYTAHNTTISNKIDLLRYTIFKVADYNEHASMYNQLAVSEKERNKLFDSNISNAYSFMTTLEDIDTNYSVCLMAYCIELDGKKKYIVK